MIVAFLAVAGAGLVLAGCATTRQSDAGPWRWSPPIPSNTPTTPRMGHSGSGGAVVASPGDLGGAMLYAYSDPAYAPEFDRRDERLGVVGSDPTAGWYAWPDSPRPSLEHTRSFSSGRNADRYVYPTTGGDSYDYHYRRSAPRGREHWYDR